MWQFLGILLLLAAVVVAIKVAILLLLLAGLIFRTRETVGLVAVLGLLALIRNYTLYCTVVAAAVGLFGLYQRHASG